MTISGGPAFNLEVDLGVLKVQLRTLYLLISTYLFICLNMHCTIASGILP